MKEYMNIKNFISKLCLVVSSIFVTFGCSTGTVECTIKGEVIDRPESKQLILKKQGEDLRIHGVQIPIVDGKFEYFLNCDHEELYELVFYDEFVQGAYKPIAFFSEQGIINFTLHPSDEFKKNIVKGGKLNSKYIDYKNEILQKANELEPSKSVDEKVKQQINKDGQLNEDTYPLYLQICREDSLYQEWIRWKLQYIREHSDVAGYSILVSEARREKDKIHDFSQFAEIFQTIFAYKYPNHPYTEKMINMLTGSSLKSGNKFVDFVAVNVHGESVRLSERIAGKPTVLHLWASWCGPCRQKGKELIPVYEEFRNKGFVVIGVAREKNIPTAEAAIKQDKYPWENLVELNDAEQIWVKYGIGNSGGSVFIIDEKGIIVAVAPTIDEIRNFLLSRP